MSENNIKPIKPIKPIKSAKSVKKTNKPKVEYEVLLTPELIEKIINLNLNIKNIFKTNSVFNDDKLLKGIIIYNKLIPYKCTNTKCSVNTMWLEEPINLIINRKNNKDKDFRLENLEFKCYNCYFQQNTNEELFIKLKKEHIITCKVCNYNMNNMSYNYKSIRICRLCIDKNSDKDLEIDNCNLFKDTFENNLDNHSFNKPQTNIDDFTSIDDMISENSDIKNVITQHNKYNSNNSNKNIVTTDPRINKTQNKITPNKINSNKINIEMHNIKVDDLSELKKLMCN